MYGIGAVFGIHPGDFGLRLQQVSAQESADFVRCHRDAGRFGGTSPQQTRVHQLVDAATDRQVEHPQGRGQGFVSTARVSVERCHGPAVRISSVL